MNSSSPVLTHSHSINSQDQASGLMLFNSFGQLNFVNREARLLLQDLQPPTTKSAGSSLLIPDEIHAIVRELVARLLKCEHPKDCEAIQVERLCFLGEQRLLLRGLCVPDAPQVWNSHVLIVMEKIHQKTPHSPSLNLQHYQFTEREQMVIIYLMLGFTNKEIANRLNLSEYTIKEHLKRIMQKTKSHTRTALLARMVFHNLKDEPSLSSPAK